MESIISQPEKHINKVSLFSIGSNARNGSLLSFISTLFSNLSIVVLYFWYTPSYIAFPLSTQATLKNISKVQHSHDRREWTVGYAIINQKENDHLTIHLHMINNPSSRKLRQTLDHPINANCRAWKDKPIRTDTNINKKKSISVVILCKPKSHFSWKSLSTAASTCHAITNKRWFNRWHIVIIWVKSRSAANLNPEEEMALNPWHGHYYPPLEGRDAFCERLKANISQHWNYRNNSQFYNVSKF